MRNPIVQQELTQLMRTRNPMVLLVSFLVAMTLRNPLTQRELIGLMRTRKAMIVVVSFAVAITLLVVLRWPGEARIELSGARAQHVFRLFAYGLLSLLILLGPAFPATSIVREKNRGTLALLLNSPMGRLSIYFGKLAGVLGFVLLLLVTSVPAAAACYAMGGISFPARAALIQFLDTFDRTVENKSISSMDIHLSRGGSEENAFGAFDAQYQDTLLGQLEFYEGFLG